MEVKLGKYMQTDFINQIMEIDRKTYPRSMCGTYQSINERFQRNRDSYILVYDQAELVGYLCFFPITNQLYNAILDSDKMADDNITAAQICNYEKVNNLFLISTVVLPEYQNGVAVRMLTGEFKKCISDKERSGCRINSISAIAVTEDGKKLLRSLRFLKKRTIENQYELFICDAKGIEELIDGT